MQSEKTLKIQFLKKRFFKANLRFLVRNASTFKAFYDHFGSPMASFFDVFFDFCFGLDFQSFSEKNSTNAKTSKVAFAS